MGLRRKRKGASHFSQVHFVAEQLGVPENELKFSLSQLFEGYARLLRAYLARVEYSDNEEFNVALCLRTESGEFDVKLTEQVASTFKEIFGAREHLDIIFLTALQEEQLRKVCCPFFYSHGYQYDAPDFFLTSSEGYALGAIRACFIVRRLLGSHSDGYMLCDIAPPIVGQPYGLGGKDIEQVVFASRHSGYSIFRIDEWPAYVHVARPVSNVSRKFAITETDLALIGWGELYKTSPLVADPE